MGQIASGGWGFDELDGNAQFIYVGQTLWVVGESTTSGNLTVYRSTDYGTTFSSVASTAVGGQGGFDPAICVDSSGNLHIVGLDYTDSGNQYGASKLVKYVFSTTSAAYTQGPVTVSASQQLAAEYDIAVLPDGATTMVVAGLLNAAGYSGYNLLAFTVSAAGAVTATTQIASGGTSTAYDAVSLVPTATGLELYYGSHPQLTFPLDFTDQIEFATYTASTTTWSSATTLFSVQCRHASPRLTVIPNSTARWLAVDYFTQSYGGPGVTAGLSGNLLLGYYDTSWHWYQLYGTPTASVVQPVLSVAPEGVRLAYILQNLKQAPFRDSQIVSYVLTGSPWTLTQDSSFLFNVNASVLRGTNAELPSGVLYGLVAQTLAGTANFYTGYNTPPAAVVSPSSLTAIRGISYVLDATASSDQNNDPMAWTWSSSDSTNVPVTTSTLGKATILVPYSVGPSQISATVTVTVEDLDQSGNPIHVYEGAWASNTAYLTTQVVSYNSVQYQALKGSTGTTPGTDSTTWLPLASPMTATSAITVPAVAAPTIQSLSTFNTTRNNQITIAPTVTTDPNTTPSYTWQQTAGTTVAMVSGQGTSALTISTAGADLMGETLTFSLTVDDQVNAAVQQSFDVAVQAYSVTVESKNLQYSLRSGSIADRNSTQHSWAALTASSVSCDLALAKKYAILDGGIVTLYCSASSCTAYRNVGSASVEWRRLFPPVSTETVLDALHTEYDYTVVLTSGQKLLFFSTAPNLNTDNPDATILLSLVTTLQHQNIAATANHSGNRVLALWGSQGATLLWINNSTYEVVEALDLTVADGLLYGSDDVLFLRMSGVRDLRTGEVLAGAKDSSGNYYQVLIDLKTRQALGGWGLGQTQDPAIQAGEILAAVSAYAGAPQAPVLSVSGSGTTATLSWTQNNTELVSAYDLQQSVGGTAYQTVMYVQSGAVLSIQLTGLLTGVVYSWKVRAIGLDGASPFSNVVSYTA